MSLSDYFTQTCTDLLKENVSLVLLKLSDPSSFVSFSATGSLVDAAKGGMGTLGAFAGDYLEKNAGALAVEALKSTGLEDSVQNAFTLANNVMAAALMANNELVMFFVRNLAKQIVLDIDAKQKKLEELTVAITTLYNLLRVLVKGNPAYSEYVGRQRQALILVASARSRLRLTRNTFDARSLWLSKTFQQAKKELQQAQELILPSQNNPGIAKAVSGAEKIASGLSGNFLSASKQDKIDLSDGSRDVIQGIQTVLGSLLEDTPIPTTGEQMQAIAAIPRASAAVLAAAQGYFGINTRLNFKLKTFKTSFAQIQSGLPGYYKKYILSLFDPALNKADSLTASMATALNGRNTAIGGPITGFRPNASKVTVLGFQWALDINLLFQSLNTIPEGALNSLSISAATTNAYTEAVKAVKALGTIKSSDVIIPYVEGEESMGDLESQLILFLLEANNAIVSNNMRQGTLNVATATLRRLALTSSRLGQLRGIMQSFINTPFELEEVTRKSGEGLLKVFKDVGLDNAVDALNSGDFNKFFKLNPRESTAVGAALITVAALKNCFPSDAAREKLSQTQFELEKDQDLLNIKFSLDFDLAILKNLKDCARATALSNNFNLQELFCGLVESSGLGSGLSKLSDALSF